LDNLNQEIQALDEARQMRNLANAVRLADSFSLLFVRCNQRPRQKEIIEELKGELADYKIKVIFLENQIEHLLDELQARLGDEKPDAIFVYGLESSFPKADEAAESKFVVTLNHSRNSFKRVLDCPLVLFVPEYALSAIYHGATDFYSIRSGVYLFSAKAEETEHLISGHIEQQQEILESLFFEERQNQVGTLKELLAEYQSLPKSQRDFGKEVLLNEKLAQLYYISGEFETSASIYQEIVKVARKYEDIVLLARNLNGLALVYKDQNKFDEAIKLQKESLRITEETVGKHHYNYAIGLNNLAISYLRQGKLDEAMELSKEAIQIDRETIGIKHPSYATHLNVLASTYSEQGNYIEAIKLYEESLNIIKETLGKNHLSYSNRLSNLASVYAIQGKYQKALSLYKESYKVGIKILGKNHYRIDRIKNDIEACQLMIKEQASLIVPYKN